MVTNIKNLKPNKHGRYRQGTINPYSCKKLFESQKSTPIIYRSSYEKRFVQWLESNHNVTHWGSECIAIKYRRLDDDTEHTYYPDYLVETINGNYLVEVKPYNQTRPPDPLLPHSSYAWQTYITNMSKWKAAQEFCERNNLHFKIITEKSIFRM